MIESECCGAKPSSGLSEELTGACSACGQPTAFYVESAPVRHLVSDPIPLVGTKGDTMRVTRHQSKVSLTFRVRAGRSWSTLGFTLAAQGWHNLMQCLSFPPALRQDVPPLVPVETLAWHYVEDGLPDDDTTVLIAVDSPDTDEVWLGFHGEHGWHNADGGLFDQPVFAWAYAPSKPAKKGCAT